MFTSRFTSLSALTLALALGGMSVQADEAVNQEQVASKQLQDRTFELERRIKSLEDQNRVLKASYAKATLSASQAQQELETARKSLEALGFEGIANRDERLVAATAEMQSLSEKLSKVEGASIQLVSATQSFLKQTLVEDPESRAQLESLIRELESHLGFRDKPKTEPTGELQDSRVISIDEQSGLLVLNVGEAQGVRIGMQFTIYRGDRLIAEAIVTDARKSICGLLVQRLDNETNGVRQGDVASLKTTHQ